MAPTLPLPPPATRLERTSILQEIFEHIEDFKDEFGLVDYNALKQEVLAPVLNDAFDPEVQIRGFLKAFRKTPAFEDAFNKVQNPKLRSQITAFIDGKSKKEVVADTGFEVASHPSGPVKHHFSLLESLKKLVISGLHLKEEIGDLFHRKTIDAHLKDLPIVYEDAAKKKPMEVYSNVPFENWGLSVNNTPRYTFLPTTVLGVQNLVQYAAKNDFRVRCAGYRHSWSNSFSEDKQILVSMVNLQTVTTLPDPLGVESDETLAKGISELKTIELKEETGPGKRLCRIGAAVTNEQFRRWAEEKNAWTIPVNIIMVEITSGGANAPICHGAGFAHKTINDYVRKIEYVDCHGKLQLVDDPKLIKAAAGCFGLLGIVTHITFELDAMQYAIMQPRKVDIGLAIPPIKKEDVPKALRASWYNASDVETQLSTAKSDFERRAVKDYYSEWFWFTYQQKAWVNSWSPVPDSVGVASYPSEADTFLQWVEGWIGGIMTSSALFNAIPGYWQAQLLATSGMAALPPTLGEDQTPTFKTHVINALHFRRGVQNMRVRDFEVEIPLQPHPDDPSKPDLSLVQKAWWDIINLVYSYADDKNDCPMRLTLELRITGGSDVVMAPQYSNKFGTAVIEVLTVPDTVTDGEWSGFVQKCADLWWGYGDQINVRPHWAKEWDGLGLKIRGKDAREYLKREAYKDQLPRFKEMLGEIGETQDWKLDELQKRFSNALWDEMIFHN